MEGYLRCLESKRVGWDVCGNVEQMWEQVKQAMVDDAREVFWSVKRGNPKNIWW